MDAIIDSRMRGSISAIEAEHLKQDLWRRTVDLSYRGLRDQPTEGNNEFWSKVLDLQEERRAGRIAVWEAEARIALLIRHSRAAK